MTLLPLIFLLAVGPLYCEPSAGLNIAEPPLGLRKVAREPSKPKTPTCGLTARSMQRKDLPNDFPFRVLEAGFAIVEIEVKNLSDGDFELNPDEIQVLNRKKKVLKRALPTEITPKIFKFYKRSTPARVHGETYAGLPPYASPRMRGRNSTTIGVNPPTPTVSAGLGPQLRSILEHYELKQAAIPAGESRRGYLYVKSKESGNRLSGGRVKLGPNEAGF